MAFALVRLQWRPADFWAATPHEFWSAMQFIDWDNRQQQAAQNRARRKIR